MADTLSVRICTIVAGVLKTPDEVRPDTDLHVGNLGPGWGKLSAIAAQIEAHYRFRFPFCAFDTWTSVADIIIATETALAGKARRAA